jgi:GntR family transcriptional regulator/MocR family aminotransferase
MDRTTSTATDEARWWSFERADGETLRSALERTLRDAIVSGALKPGVRLPASRALAHDLGVSRGVVSDAYDQLGSQGFVISRPRRAPVVAAVTQSGRVPRPPAPAPCRPRFDLTPTTPDVTLFPLARWLTASQRAARAAGVAMLGYRSSRGEATLREALAGHLGRTRGVIADPDHILITQGTAQGLDLLLRVLRARGATRVTVESPSHTTQHERIAAHGLESIPQAIDSDGIVVDGLRADAVLVTPAHQFPTGSVLSAERRRRLLAWARGNAALIIEDDYDAEFRYDREPVRALQGLGPEHVAELGTVSKTLAPALRLGWIVAPPGLVDELEQQKRLCDDFSPAHNQLTLAEFLRCGDYDRHLRRARIVYRARRDRLRAALHRHLPELAVTGVAAGLHLVLQLPPSADDRAISMRAWESRICVPALSTFELTHQTSHSKGLVLGYGLLHESAIEPAVTALAPTVHAELDRR